MATQVKNCYIALNGKKHGPLSEQDIQQLYAQGKITDATKFARTGAKGWIPLSESGLIEYDDDFDIDEVPAKKTGGNKFVKVLGGIVGSIVLFFIVVGILSAIFDDRNVSSDKTLHNTPDDMTSSNLLTTENEVDEEITPHPSAVTQTIPDTVSDTDSALFEFTIYNDAERGIQYAVIDEAVEKVDPDTRLKQFIWESKQINANVSLSVRNNPIYDEDDRLFSAEFRATNNNSPDWRLLGSETNSYQTVSIAINDNDNIVTYIYYRIHENYQFSLLAEFPEKYFDTFFDIIDILEKSLSDTKSIGDNKSEKSQSTVIKSGNMTEKQVNDEVSRIREIWTEDRNAISSKLYTSDQIASGVTGYYKDGETKNIEVAKGVSGVDYSRIYQFENGQLVFAYLEGDDAHRLYFIQDSLFRWRYAANSAKPDKYTDYDNRTDLNDYTNLQNFALDEAYSLKAGKANYTEHSSDVNAIQASEKTQNEPEQTPSKSQSEQSESSAPESVINAIRDGDDLFKTAQSFDNESMKTSYLDIAAESYSWAITYMESLGHTDIPEYEYCLDMLRKIKS